MKEVVFSACLSSEVAWESNGQGEFTVRAMQAFASNPGVSNAQFADRITANFGPTPRQHAKLYSTQAAGKLAFLQPLATGVLVNPGAILQQAVQTVGSPV